MSILSDKEIINAVKRGDIYIDNFNPERIYKDNSYTGKLGPNSYDLTLNEKLLVYTELPLDMKNNNPTKEIIIPPEGLVLQPGVLYLGKTNEYTKTNKYVPFLEGRSSTGRLGMYVFVTAGAGDVGYHGNWTLEIVVTQPLRIYANTSVCQIIYHTVEGEVKNTYKGKYFGATDILPTMMYKDEIFNKEEKKEGLFDCLYTQGAKYLKDIEEERTKEKIKDEGSLYKNDTQGSIYLKDIRDYVQDASLFYIKMKL